MPNLKQKVIAAQNAPKAVGPYSQAIQVGSMVYVSGCLGLDPSSMTFVSSEAVNQAEKALDNVEAILTAAGSSLGKVVKSTIFLQDINDYSAINEIYKKRFREPFPARSCVQVAKLPMGAKVEIEVVAISGLDN